MWYALRAELIYSRPWLLGGLGVAALVTIILSVVFFAVGDDGPPRHIATGLRGMFPIMAPMIVGFIIQAYRSEERRARLLLAGHLTSWHAAGAMVLLPVVLFGVGVVAAGLVMGAGVLVVGELERESLNLVGFVGGQMLAYAQMGLLVQEAAAARSQRRLLQTIVGWTAFVLAVLFLAALYVVLALEFLTWIHLFLGHLVVAVTAMVVSAGLYAGRNDFTR